MLASREDLSSSPRTPDADGPGVTPAAALGDGPEGSCQITSPKTTPATATSAKPSVQGALIRPDHRIPPIERESPGGRTARARAGCGACADSATAVVHSVPFHQRKHPWSSRGSGYHPGLAPLTSGA